ncbi:hypothetical protein EIP91_006028 [Steccherinum ochraceum]|uniref:Uncharacterized protein n=1 Tax=Steccherinum ochraceum TaxID=92696 RepID=A0A4R0R6M5_9APHY|nr:hypothetical protein EIP91_006028 [Steccherinum ochraceum]
MSRISDERRSRNNQRLQALRNAVEERYGLRGLLEIRWLNDALARTEDYYTHGPRGPATWVLTLGKNFPEGAFNASSAPGRDVEPVYVARGFLQSGIQVGIASARTALGAVLGWNWDEFPINLYETLVVAPDAVKWVPGSNALNLASLGARPVEGGYEANAEPLYVAQAYLGDAWLPGKHGSHLPAAHIPHGGIENLINHYRILCYADDDLVEPQRRRGEGY